MDSLRPGGIFSLVGPRAMPAPDGPDARVGSAKCKSHKVTVTCMTD